MSRDGKILVTGAKGMLGSDLVPLLRANSYNVNPVDIDDFDIVNYKDARKYLIRSNPDIIIHCASFTDVDKAELEEKDKTILINAVGTENISNIAMEINSKLIYISTDYVFDGEKDSPYIPEDTTLPINVYGASKLDGEKAILKNPEGFIVRTSWLYGIHGKNFVKTIIKLAREKEVLYVVNDQIGCPTWTMDLSKSIIALIDKEITSKIFHMCGNGSCSWYEFACKILEIMKIQVKVIPVTSKEFPRAAKRPKNSSMYNNNLCPHWKDSLKEFINIHRDSL